MLSANGRDYKKHVSNLRMLLEGKMHTVFKDGLVSVDVQMHVPDRRIRDTDNILKPLFDALVHAKYMTDDSQIAKHSVTRHDKDINGGRVIVTIESINS